MLRIVCLPGDGIGPEVTAVAIDVLRALPLELEIEEHPFGGRAILDEGIPLPAQTLAACKAAMPSFSVQVGLPQFEGASVRPEQGLIALRRLSMSTRTCVPRRGPASTC
jgi:3-isopropylmalate dehydrogenase